MAPRTAKQAPDPDLENVEVDDAQEQDNLTGPIPEGELELARAVAKRMGWAPKEEWTRDPAKWQNAPDFLEGTAQAVEALKERTERYAAAAERSARAAAEAIEADRANSRRELEERLRKAENPDDRVQIGRELAEVSGPHPETVAWMSRNPWMKTDPNAAGLAISICNRLAAQKVSIPDQLAEAEAEVRKHYPEHFTVSQATRLSEIPRTAPAVQPGNRAATTPKEKGFAQLPRPVREAFIANPKGKASLQSVMMRAGKGRSQQEAQTLYARGYWRENDE